MPLYNPPTTSSPIAHVNGYRLTGATLTPVMQGDSTSLSTIYLTPYLSNQITLLDASGNTTLLQSAEVSLALAGRTTDVPFDIFAYNNSGVLTLEFLDWTNGTTRGGTGLTRSGGILTNFSDITRRYLGTCRPRSATTYSHVMNGSQAPARLDLWNYENRVNYTMTCVTTTATWTYQSTAIRQAQGSTNYQCEFVIGLREDIVTGRLQCGLSAASTSTTVTGGAAIGYDVTNATFGIIPQVTSGISGQRLQTYAEYSVLPTLGRHYMSWCEVSQATTAVTFYGANTNQRSGLTVSVRG